MSTDDERNDVMKFNEISIFYRDFILDSLFPLVELLFLDILQESIIRDKDVFMLSDDELKVSLKRFLMSCDSINIVYNDKSDSYEVSIL